MKMFPKNKNIAIQRLDVDDRTPGGIFLPDTTVQKTKPQRGIVFEVCQPFVDDNGREWKSGYSPGDKVFFAKYVGEELVLPDRTAIVFMKESDILAAGRSEPDADLSPSLSQSQDAFAAAAPSPAPQDRQTHLAYCPPGGTPEVPAASPKIAGATQKAGLFGRLREAIR